MRPRSASIPPAAGLCALVSALAAAPASAIVIDNLEQTGFSLAANPGTSANGVYPQTQGVNCIAPDRQVWILSNGTQGAGATLNTFLNYDDEVATVMPGNGGGALTLRYNVPGYVDLTGAGAFEAIRVMLTTAPVIANAGWIRILITDAGGNQASFAHTVNGPGTFVWSYSQFPGVDMTDVGEIEVYLNADVEGDFHIRDIRCLKTGTTQAEWTVVEEDEIPQEETSPDTGEIVWEVESEEPSPSPAFSAFKLKLASVRDQTGGPAPAHGMAGVPVSPVGTAQAEFHRDGGGEMPSALTLTLRLGLCDAGRLLAVESASSSHTDQTHRVGIRVAESDPGTGGSLGWTEYEMASFIPLGGAWRITGSSATQVDDHTVEATVALESTSSKPFAAAGSPPAGHLFSMNLEAVHHPAATTAAEGTEPSRPVIAAYPSVTRGGTELRLAAPADRPTGVAVYDVQGRSVRVLRIGAGMGGVRWDGADAQGRAAGAGVYFIRVAGSAGSSARVVKVR